MNTTRRGLLPLLGLSVLLLGATGRLGRAAEGEKPPIDREEHETVKTATFALG